GCDVDILGEQVDDVEVVDVLDEVRHQGRTLDAEQVGQLDAEEHLHRVGAVDAGGFQHVAGNVHQHAGGDQHLVGATDPDIDEDDDHLRPAVAGEEGDVVHVGGVELDDVQQVGAAVLVHHCSEDVDVSVVDRKSVEQD